eukprot:scaffold96838_cov62-Cyclotella_meneghiniana.AAC.1
MKPPYAGDMPRVPIHRRIPIPTPVAHQSRVICRLFFFDEAVSVSGKKVSYADGFIETFRNSPADPTTKRRNNHGQITAAIVVTISCRYKPSRISNRAAASTNAAAALP